MRLLLLALLLCSGACAEWDVEFFKLDNLYRTDLLGPAGGKLVQAIACYSMHAIGVGQDCDSPGFFRQYFPADQLIMLVPIIPGMHTLIDAITSDGERCVRELPRERIAVTVETGPEAQTVPWYQRLSSFFVRLP